MEVSEKFHGSRSKKWNIVAGPLPPEGFFLVLSVTGHAGGPCDHCGASVGPD